MDVIQLEIRDNYYYYIFYQKNCILCNRDNYDFEKKRYFF